MESIGTDAAAIEVLLVEDRRNDVLLTREALKNTEVQINLHVASDGVEAMAFLGRDGEYAGVPRPDLILLDMNLPKKNGRKVLEEIKQSPTLKSIPVVILTSAASDADILRKDGLHAEYFITKPVTLDGFLNVVESIDRRKTKT
jgi:CheY-like chemotaxis protein